MKKIVAYTVVPCESPNDTSSGMPCERINKLLQEGWQPHPSYPPFVFESCRIVSTLHQVMVKYEETPHAETGN